MIHPNFNIHNLHFDVIVYCCRNDNKNNQIHNLRIKIDNDHRLYVIYKTKFIYALGRIFRALDSYDDNRKVEREEFLVGLRENGVDIDAGEASKLLDYFDKDGDGCFNIDEFLVRIRGELNEKRKKVVLQAFRKFDKDGSGVVSIDDLLSVYSVHMHLKIYALFNLFW